jgi:hypothetical protein
MEFRERSTFSTHRSGDVSGLVEVLVKLVLELVLFFLLQPDRQVSQLPMSFLKPSSGSFQYYSLVMKILEY